MTIKFTLDHDHTYEGGDGEEQLVGWIHCSVTTYPGDFRSRVSGGSPKTIKLPTRSGWLAADGHVYNDATSGQPFRLVANDPDFNLDHITYKVEFELTTLLGDPVDVHHCYFPAPSTDTTVYLTRFMVDPDQTVMEVRSKVYAEDILDAGGFGATMLSLPDIDAARDLMGLSNDVYNWKASNTRLLQQSLGRALSDVGAADHVIIGDSISSCYVGDDTEADDYFKVWPLRMRTHLDLRGVPLGGTGWVPAGNVAGADIDPRYETTGTWAWDSGYAYPTTFPATITFTSDLPGTDVTVGYYSGGTAFTASVDGAAAVTLTPSGGSPASLNLHTFSGLDDTTHTLTLTFASTGASIFGVNVSRDTGLRIHNFSQIGDLAYKWRAGTTGYGSNGEGRRWFLDRSEVEPDVIWLALGVNDIDAGHSVASVVGYLTEIREDFPDADVVLIGQPAPSPSADVVSPPTNDYWASFIAALKTLADEFDCPFINLYQRTGGSYAAANAAGLMGDTIHPNRIAHADWGLLAANCVMGMI